MRRTLLTLLLTAWPVAVSGQGDPLPTRQQLPRDVGLEVAERWNKANALRSSERLEVGPEQEIRGDVVVQHGPLVIAGHVIGNVLAVNADVLLRATARIDGDLLVVGGDVEGRTLARVDGGIRIYRQSLAYSMENDRLALNDSGIVTTSWWQRFDRRRVGSFAEPLRVVQAGAYNRVEGLPIEVGPLLHRNTVWGSLRLEPAAIVRTGSSFSSSEADVGYNIRTEIRTGHVGGIGIGGRVFSIVAPVEDWQLSDLEVALGAFLVRRDYRDYYQRHGGELFVSLYGSPELSVTAGYGNERWTSRVLKNPFTVFNGEQPWRW